MENVIPWLISGGILVLIAASEVNFRRWRRSIREPISPEIQAEIDQTPEWWDREFRRLQGIPEPKALTTADWSWEMEYRIQRLSEQGEDD